MPLKHQSTKFHENKHVPIPQNTEDIEKIVHVANIGQGIKRFII
jgi:hypothetical protein